MDGERAIAGRSIDGEPPASIARRIEVDPQTSLVTGETAMRELGSRLSRRLRIGDVVLLHGNLGAGKTTLTQGIGAGLSIREAIQSPTFGLVAEHEGVAFDGSKLRLYHLDLYRLDDPDDLESIGFDHYANPDDGITVIEWPERAIDWLPNRYLLVSIAYAGLEGRFVSIRSVGSDDSSNQEGTR